MIKRRSFLKAGAGAALAGLAARSGAADLGTPRDLAENVEILRQTLALHPGLHRYASPRTMQAQIDAFGRAFAAALTIEQRYLILSGFLTTIRCGHSYANFYNQKKAIASQLFGRPTRLPVRFVWARGQLIVTLDPSGTLPPGTRVAGIDGRPVLAMRRALLAYVRADGSNDAKRVSLLEVRGHDRIETFDVFQGLLFSPAGAAFRVKRRHPVEDRERSKWRRSTWPRVSSNAPQRRSRTRRRCGSGTCAPTALPY